jgi:hypothetical protein
MSNIMTKQVNINLKLQRRLSLGLAAATLVVALLFFAGSVLLNEPWFAAQVAQTGLTLESFVAVFTISIIALSIGAFVISWNQRSFLGAGLLAASGVILIIHPLTTIFMTHVMKHSQMAAGHSAAIPGGPILVVILGLGILVLGVAKGLRTPRTAVAAAR